MTPTSFPRYTPSEIEQQVAEVRRNYARRYPGRFRLNGFFKSLLIAPSNHFQAFALERSRANLSKQNWNDWEKVYGDR